MADSDKEAAAMIPSWQQAAPTAASETADNSSSHTASMGEGNILEQARKFLQDDAVRLSSREKKVEFLKSKGIEEPYINELLEKAETTATPTTARVEERAEPIPSDKRTVAATPEPETKQEQEPETRPSHPPIITYPEFLTKPAKPPPLITANGLLNSLGVVAGLSTLVYGATRYLVSPMVETLTEARIDFHDNANKNLSRLVEKLEHAVSELPPSYHAVAAGKRTPETHKSEGTAHHADDSSSSNNSTSPYDDPTELFHRDVGVQTSRPPSPDRSSAAYPWPPSGEDQSRHDNDSSNKNTTQQQADKLNKMISSVRGLSGDLASQAEGLADTKGVLDRFGESLHELTYPPESFGGSGGSSYVYGAARVEPDDEIRRVKNSIRSVKGVLLSTRSFPAAGVR
ncbi:hypothetical protein VPNG_01249 [Cytospora leucostoma]|uniref:Peroxisomal membrane protein PEX14 n=1 Tax=Cytospora leucostoma TaxID=1230097 RepID=A0A423XLD8_9PEZI|nr:hypothetical protein VPNG_01249 [Cytospora leucostoma]